MILFDTPRNKCPDIWKIEWKRHSNLCGYKELKLSSAIWVNQQIHMAWLLMQFFFSILATMNFNFKEKRKWNEKMREEYSLEVADFAT